MTGSYQEALSRIRETGGHTIAVNPCKKCASQPACRLVQKKEGATISPGSTTCQRIASAEEESGKR